MFRRLFIEDWTVIFTIIAFITALSVYGSVFYRALKMRRPQIDRLSHLPFEGDGPATEQSAATTDE
ncbi:hypothetical protein [Synoicihabitans lomoniglobus]|uniref:Cbb3-type cytochrome c oxidase subunit 3 n=1 Tax=Synoicihabitans lomoniglobus TaxID=2909285 RepID=A0AAE9ZV00_9BACT|nr:hypothetical protein [Opitutaceae bacterium LMO-M01]WED63554.1 hypothetical protein PXH66_14550 [Opitutaceae bacterium LMO-M01]